MKITTGKTAVTLLVAMLVASSMLVLQAQGEVITTASLGIVPNPVMTGHPIQITVDVTPLPEVESFNWELEVFDTTTDELLFGYYPYPTNLPFVLDWEALSPGTYNYTFRFLGYSDPDVTYLPSEASVILTVYEEYYETPVEPGLEVTVYPDPSDLRVSLTFQEVLTPGIVTLTKTPNPPEGVPALIGIIGFYYDLDHTFEYRGIVRVGIPYDEPLPEGAVESKLTVWHYEIIGDVNGDGKVNLKDTLMITLALGTQPGNRRWNPACDLNSDGKVNLQDLVLALRNFGKTASAWRNVTTWVDTVNNIVYGETPNFPPFGVRR